MEQQQEVVALKGIKQILVVRLLEKQDEVDGQKLLYQVEHSTDLSTDSDSVITKDGPINTEGTVEEEISITSIAALGDPTIAELEDAFRNRKVVELWEINTQSEVGENKFDGLYRQGKLTGFSKSATAEDFVELEMTYKTDLTPQKGACTLSEEQAQVVQYKFIDTVNAGSGEEV